MTGWYITAAGHAQTLMLTVGIVVGVRAGYARGRRVGADISVTASMPLSITTALVVLISGLGMGLMRRRHPDPPRLLRWRAGRRRLRLVSHLITGTLNSRTVAVGVAPSSTGLAATALADRVRAPSSPSSWPG